MKKVIICLLLSLIFSLSNAFCEEASLIDMKNTSMPTDEEIMETIKKFNFDKTQQEYLFKETKKQLEEMYAKRDFSSILQGDSTILNDSDENKEKVKNTKKYSGRSKNKD